MDKQNQDSVRQRKPTFSEGQHQEGRTLCRMTEVVKKKRRGP